MLTATVIISFLFLFNCILGICGDGGEDSACSAAAVTVCNLSS